jgi:hypothetical protein
LILAQQYSFFSCEFSVEVGHESATSPNALERSASSTPLAPKNVKDLRENPGYSNVDIFTYEEMRLATKCFRPDLILGEGGFGIVYKGGIDENVRPGYKTTQVAIKELNREGFQGDREWLVFDLSLSLFMLLQYEALHGECDFYIFLVSFENN